MDQVQMDLSVLEDNDQIEIKQKKFVQIKKTRIAYYLIGLFLILFSVIFITGALKISTHSRSQEILTPGSFPLALSIILLILGVVLLIQTYLKKYDGVLKTEESEEALSEEKVNKKRERLRQSPALLMISSILYVFLIGQIGFFVSTALYSLFILYLIDIMTWFKRIILLAGLLLFIYIVFVQLLAVRLPIGPWGF